MRKILVILTVLLTFTACDNSSVFTGRHEFSEILWKKSVTPKFVFTIDKETECKIDFELRLIYGYPYRNMKLNMMLTGDNGFEKTFPLDFKVRDEDDKYLGEVMGDFIDIVSPVIDEIKLEHGQYKIVLDQTLDEKTLPFVMEVGVIFTDKNIKQ